MGLSPFTLVHVGISLIAICAGLVANPVHSTNASVVCKIAPLSLVRPIVSQR